MILSHAGSDDGLEISAAANTEVVRAQLKSLGTLGSKDEIDDILITLSTQYDIVRPLAANPSVFLYLAMDKNKSNLAMARYKVAECEKQLEAVVGRGSDARCPQVGVSAHGERPKP